MVRFLISGLFFFCSVWAVISHSQDIDYPEYEAFVEETMKASTVPGLAVVLFDESGFTYENAFGVVDDKGTDTTLDTPFQLGSVSKSFAALLVLQLVAEGQLDLDNSILTYLLDFRPSNAGAWEKITLRHLLSHRTGLSTVIGNRLQDNNYRGADALSLAVKTLENAKLKSSAGEQYEYSNANYMITALIIETVSGQTYETLMDERIFQPLGMNSSYVQMPLRETQKESMGFLQWFRIPVAQRVIPGRAWMAAGGVTASARDLAIYVNAVATNDPRIIPPELATEFTKPEWKSTESDYGYGLGWMFYKLNDQTVIYHSGLNGGFAAHAAFFPETRQGGVVVTNQSGALQVDVPGIVLRRGLGTPSEPHKPSLGQYFLVWGLLANTLMMFFFFGLSTKRFSAYVKRVGKVSWFRRGVPAFALFGLAYGLIFVVPKMNGIHLNGIKVFQPDVWLCLTLSAIIAIVWGLTRLIYPWKKA
jgi:CubicO group peptidase (beta-lactamase class C family)